MNLPQTSSTEQELGFQLLHTIFFPLPCRASGTVFSRKLNGITCTFSDPEGVPYGKIDRLWLEAFVTFIKQTGESRIELERVSDELKKLNLDRNGNYITSARKAISRLYKLSVDLEAERSKRDFTLLRAKRFSVGKDLQLVWGTGRADREKTLYLPGMNYIEFSAEFVKTVTDFAVPHVREHFLEIRSPRTLDLYQWLILRLYGLKEPTLVRWRNLYEQFGSDEVMSVYQRREIRDDIKQGLLEIRTKYYPKARIEATAEGLILKPSDPLIEPGDPKAGYSVL